MQQVTILPRTVLDHLLSGVIGISRVIDLPDGIVTVSFQSIVSLDDAIDLYIWLQTSFDNGLTWCDIISHSNFRFIQSKLSNISLTAVPTGGVVTTTDGELTVEGVIQGLIGSKLRVKYAYNTVSEGETIQVNITFGGLDG